MKKAGITIYLSLMLMLIISVISVSILSVKVQAGRSRVANSADQAMFSLFAQYDRDLLAKYDVFFIDGTAGSGAMRAGAIYRRFTEAMEYILKPNKGNITGGRNLLDLSVTEGAFTGYTLATDVNGGIYAAQAVDYMKETAGIQAISLLLGKYGQEAGIAREQEAQKDAVSDLYGGSSYSDILEASDAAKRADAAEAEQMAEAGIGGMTEAQARAEAVSDDFVNPLPFIEKLRGMSIADLVTGGNVSDKALNEARASSRGFLSGVGIIDVPEGIDSFETGMIFNEYILTHFGSYAAPESGGALDYQAEYILQGRTSDRENINAMVTKLLLLREAANMAFLYTSAARKAELEAASAAIAALLYIPFAQPAIQALLAAGWAFCESVVDVRALLKGHRVAAFKNDAAWKVTIASIPALIAEGGIDGMAGDDSGGMSYTDYIRVLLALSDRQSHLTRTLDLVESNLRHAGREGFRIDCCIEALTAEVSVMSEKRVRLTEEITMRYRDFVRGGS